MQMSVPEGLYYTEEHEWIRLEGSVATIGITDYAQKKLGDIVFIELPEMDSDLAAGDTVASVGQGRQRNLRPGGRQDHGDQRGTRRFARNHE